LAAEDILQIGNIAMNRKQRRAAASQGKGIHNRSEPGASAGSAVQIAEQFATARQHYRAGRLAEAEHICWRTRAVDPNHVGNLHLLGVLAHHCGRNAVAVEIFGQLLALKPDLDDAHNNLGAALWGQGKTTEALACFRRALAISPKNAGAHSNLGAVLWGQGSAKDAIDCFEQALALMPNHFDARNNLGAALKELGRYDEALMHCKRALELNRHNASAHNNLGNALKEMGRIEKAVAHYERALALQPHYAEAHNNIGTAYKDLGRFDEEAAQYKRALELKPDYAEAHNNLGTALRARGELDEAVAHYERALALRPNYAEVKFALCMAELPILYKDELEITKRRAAYWQRLAALCNDVDHSAMPGELTKAVGANQPFFLAYQGYNDRDLQRLYGSVVCRIMAARYPRASLGPPPGADEPVRVGIVSGFFRQHSNWKIPIKGWMNQLNRQRFRVFAYYTGIITDTETKQAAAQCDRFVQGPLSLDRWRQVILADAPHVLIYPEVGMDPVSAQLAAQRLAPVQCNSWGHPDTSGFPTLDYFLSSELMEPPDGQDHYTERLFKLPNLSIYYEPVGTPPVSLTRADLGLRPESVVYWCGQSLFKYLPQFDKVFPRIAREVGDCKFVFIQHQRGAHVTDLFQKRLEQSFGTSGLRAAEHCVFLPRLDQHRFSAVTGQCDIVLDSIGWSGCNSTLESLQHDLPIVTMTGALMRGRHTMAILKMLGVEETLTETTNDYISTAIRLAWDIPWRMAIKKRISENKHRVYRDTTCVLALEEFLNRATRNGAGD
jgi:predicted O-linked N-acetylglucosamine transferase (SPINDLY family)